LTVERRVEGDYIHSIHRHVAFFCGHLSVIDWLCRLASTMAEMAVLSEGDSTGHDKQSFGAEDLQYARRILRLRGFLRLVGWKPVLVLGISDGVRVLPRPLTH
jgi:hypothetical protein